MQTSSGATLKDLGNGYLRKSFPQDNPDSEYTCRGQFKKLDDVYQYCKNHSIDCPSPKVINMQTNPYSYDMEYIKGKTLKDYEFDSDEDAINIIIEILEGLKVWHDADVCHNDLHSGNGENILITNQNKIKIIDPIVKERSSTKPNFNIKFEDFLSAYKMIISFVYPHISSSSTKDKINISFLRETYRDEINNNEAELDEFTDNIKKCEVRRAYIDTDINNIIENLKNI